MANSLISKSIGQECKFIEAERVIYILEMGLSLNRSNTCMNLLQNQQILVFKIKMNTQNLDRINISCLNSIKYYHYFG